MAVTFGEADAVAVEHLITEIARPIGPQRAASVAQFARTMMLKSNRRGAARVNLVASDVVLRVGDEVVNAVDFSLRGVQFRTPTRLTPGHSVILTIRWREEAASHALGRVMWSTFEKPGRLVDPHYRIGVAFENSDVRVLRTILDKCGLGGAMDVKVVQTRW